MKKIINFKRKLAKFNDLWSPKIISEFNEQEIKLVKLKGDFVSHKHDKTDEVFIVLEGKLKIEFKDKIAELNKGEMIVIPSGEKHKPFSDEECKIILIERKNTINTGGEDHYLKSPNDIWI
ncbi:MAG: cupin [Flavobacteriaceae bacterium]|nr:cupin [Flavobacteriaceae bacterium]